MSESYARNRDMEHRLGTIEEMVAKLAVIAGVYAPTVHAWRMELHGEPGNEQMHRRVIEALTIIAKSKEST